MLLNMAIADAYGAGFEFSSYSIIQQYNTGDRYVNHTGSRVALGHYTDDTQMALALAELMLSGKEWTQENIAQAFLYAFHRDQRVGYAGGFYKFLQVTKTGEAFLQNIQPYSEKSGAAMRSAPLGLFPDVYEVIGKTQIQASVTHNTYAGTASAVAVALASHYCIYDIGEKKYINDFISDYVAGRWKDEWQGAVSVQGLDCVKAALTAIQKSSTLTELLIHCVEFTGDTDTVACIAFGIASYCDEIQQDLSNDLYTELENGSYGKDYLNDIDEKLVNRFIQQGQLPMS